MHTSITHDPRTAASKPEIVGRIATVTGSQSTVELTTTRILNADSPTVGKFMGLLTG